MRISNHHAPNLRCCIMQRHIPLYSGHSLSDEHITNIQNLYHDHVLQKKKI